MLNVLKISVFTLAMSLSLSCFAGDRDQCKADLQGVLNDAVNQTKAMENSDPKCIKFFEEAKAKKMTGFEVMMGMGLNCTAANSAKIGQLYAKGMNICSTQCAGIDAAKQFCDGDVSEEALAQISFSADDAIESQDAISYETVQGSGSEISI